MCSRQKRWKYFCQAWFPQRLWFQDELDGAHNEIPTGGMMPRNTCCVLVKYYLWNPVEMWQANRFFIISINACRTNSQGSPVS